MIHKDFNLTAEQYSQNPLTKEQVEHLRRTLQEARKFDHTLSALIISLTSIILVSIGVYLFLNFDKVLGLVLPIVFGTFFIPLFLISVSDHTLKKHPVFIYIDGKNQIEDIHHFSLEYTNINHRNIQGSETATTLYENILKQGRGVLEFEKRIIKNLCTI